jgi:hypothetical protein
LGELEGEEPREEERGDWVRSRRRTIRKRPSSCGVRSGTLRVDGPRSRSRRRNGNARVQERKTQEEEVEVSARANSS